MHITSITQAGEYIRILTDFIQLKRLIATDQTLLQELIADAFIASGENTNMDETVFDVTNIELDDDTIIVHTEWHNEENDKDNTLTKSTLYLTHRDNQLYGEY